jgi:glutamate/tyrosine decarboxylase-like PLP-dependent enzyme
VPAREKYQRMAKRCVRAAERLHDPIERRRLLEVAGGYMALARHVAERHDHGTAHRGLERDSDRYPHDA